MSELKVRALTEKLSEVLVFIDGMLEENDCPVKTQFQIDVAVEEIFVNIANYAYNEEGGDAEIEASVSGDPKVIKITFKDSGMPYDPLKKEDPDVTLGIEDRQIGGLGIFMVKKSMDNVEYEHKDGKNILTIYKTLI
ncbi:MAG: ATP-binding protein [Lachnospiraceae bacterium]|nr:ATP-binding protein [Lachnospiraceae bacterium]